jgi:hypothetical protein
MASSNHSAETSIRPLRIFLSYGHDEHASVAARIKSALETRGHQVWFDRDRLPPGGDWETHIEAGLRWVAEEPGVGRVVLLMTPHAVRRPDGYCLNELARALAQRLPIVPVMLVWVEPPLSICRLQWLDMTSCLPPDDRPAAFTRQLDLLFAGLEHNNLDETGVQARLSHLLEPLPFDEEIAQDTTRFIGRHAVIDTIERWLARPQPPLLITGGPGSGKTMLATWLAGQRREVVAWHFCRAGHSEKNDPRRWVTSAAFQLASQLPEYGHRLAALNLESMLDRATSSTALFDLLFVEPAATLSTPDHPMVLIVDALDEATTAGRNPLSHLLAEAFRRVPPWLRLLVTTRPEPGVLQSWQDAVRIDLDSDPTAAGQDVLEFLVRELGRLGAPRPAIERIAARAAGSFAYAEAVRREVAGGHLTLDHLDAFPSSLGAFYASCLARQFQDPAAYRERYRPVFELMLAADGPLPLEVATAVLEWSPYAGRDTVAELGSLVEVTGNAIQFFHGSLAEWLADADRAGPFWVARTEGDRRLAAWGWNAYRQHPDATPEYAAQHLATHLLRAGRLADLAQLFSDPQWMARRLLVGVENRSDERRRRRLHMQQEIVGLGAEWSPARDLAPLADGLKQFADSGWSTFRSGVNWEFDEGKLILMSAVNTAAQLARTDPALTRLIPVVLDRRLQSFLSSPVSFEGLNGEYSGWLLHNAVDGALAVVETAARPELEAWLAEWRAAESPPEPLKSA